MLAADDAALLARHPQLPGLGLVLDADALAEAVDRLLPDLRLDGASATYVRLKPGTSCVVGYRLALRGGRTLDAYARTSASAGDPKVAKRVAAAQAAGREPGGALLDARTALLLHPCDHDLPAVARLADPARRPEILARAMDRPPTDGWALATVRHNPERRWVGRLTGPDGRRLLVKVHRPAPHRRALAGATVFTAAGVPASRLVGSSRRHGITVHEWVDGPPAVDVLSGSAPALDMSPGGAPAVAADIGALLARLHLAEVRAAARRLDPVPHEGQQLDLGVAAVAALDPAAGEVAGRIARRLAGRIEPPWATRRPSLLHGDCSVDQIILAAGGPTLIDLDRAAHGDPHTDLAQLLADLALRHAVGALAHERQLGTALLDGYTAAGGTADDDRLAALTAARLVRLAPEPFRRRQPGWRATLDRVLERADALAAGAVRA